MSRFVQHPFGRENEVSVRRLLYSFCNNLYLGQWELAEACTNELHEQRDLDKGDITSLLEDIVSYPYERSIGAANKSIQSPHHLSWMCLEALKKLIGKVSEEKREEVEFRLILFEADLPKQIAKEYHVFYTRTVQKETPPNLSEVSLEALGNFMLDNPMVAHTMIQKLTAVCTDKEQKMFLYEVYITTIQKILSKLHTRKSGQASEDGTDLGSEKVSIDVVFHVLSLFSAPECYIEELRDRFSELFHFIINVVLNSGGEFGLEHIYSALLGRDSDSLLQIFLASFRDYKRKSIAFHRQLDFNATELEACVLSLSDKGDRKKLWEELYLSALPQNQHALDVVMGLGIKLVKSSQFTQLKKLLAVEDFSCLKPLLMLIGWDHCRSITQGYELVESLQDLCTENILLHKSCHRLKRKATQLKQFLHMIKEYLPDDSADIEALLKHHHFSGLSQYSPLYMLNNSCTLSQMPEEGVMALLKSEASGLSHGSLVEVSIYQGFCAIKSFLAALINSASMRSWVARSADSSDIYSRETPTDPIDRDSPAHLGMNRTSSCSHSPVSTLDLEDLQIKYPEKVLEHLEHVKSILSELQPLHYRVEILENLFSLLFVRLDCIDDEGETNEELPGNECDNQDQPSSPPLDDTPVPGTPVTPTTPVYLTPSKVLDSHLGSHLGSMGGRLEKVTRNLNQDFFPKFMANLSSIQEKQTANKQGKFERVLNDQEDGLHDMDDTSDGHNSDKEGVKTKKDQQQTHKVKEMTDNSSAASKGSSLGLGHLGFIANEYFVRDALFMLKACVEQVSSSLSEAEDIAAYDRLQCSLTRSSVKQHSIRLTQYISEGLWRLQLISHRAVPFEYGKILADISRLDYDSSEEEPNWTDDEQTSSSTAKKRKRKHTSDSQSGTEGHMTNEGSQSNNTSISRKSPRQRHSHHPRRQRSKRGARGLMESGLGGVIPRMLADRNSLLVMCLRRGKFSQASQVVKLFGLEQTVEDAEVLFADHFQAAVEKVHSHDSKLAKHLAHEQEMSRHKSPLSGTRLSLTSQSLIGNIASKAAKGASTMTVSNTAEQLLGLTIQPALHHRSGDIYSLLKPPLNQHINPDLIPAMIVLDLACSSSTTWESSGVLLDVAMRRLPSHLKQGKMAASGSHERDLMEPPSVLYTQSSKKDTKPLCALKGIMGVLERLSTLVQSCSSKPEVMGNVTSHCSGINTCLNTGVAPLDAESCTILYLALKELESALQKTQVALKSFTLLSDGRERSRGHHGRTGREQDAKRPSLRTAFKNLVTQCSKATVKNGLMQYIVRDSQEETDFTYKYLHVCFEYFKILSTLLAEYEGKNRETISQLEYFSMLHESPTDTLGKTLFLHKADPYRLQEVTESLNIDLVQVILHNTCPPITSVPTQLMSSPIKEVGDTSHWDCLNSGPVSACGVLARIRDDPVRLVETLLMTWLHFLRDYNHGKGTRNVLRISDLRTPSKTAKCKGHLCNSRLLQEVDLSLLKSNDEKLCFFLNLSHCMLLHGLLHLMDKEDFSSLSSLLGSHTEVEEILAERLLLYTVGQLGRISWYDVHNIILDVGGRAKHQNLSKQLSIIQDIDRYDPWGVYRPVADVSIRPVVINKSFAFYFQVYYPELLHLQLKVAEKDLLTNGEVIGSTGICLCRDIFLSTQKNASGTPHTVEYYNIVQDCVPVSCFCQEGKTVSATYKLSQSVRSYLRYKSGLIATMAGLVSIEDNSMTTADPTLVNPQANNSDIHRLQNGVYSTTTSSSQMKEDFPFLHRHLETQVIHLVSGADDNKMASIPDQLWHIITKDLSSSMRVTLFSSSQTSQLQTLLRGILLELIHSHKWKQLADLCIYCPLVSRLESTEWIGLKTLAILTAIACIKSYGASDTARLVNSGDLVHSEMQKSGGSTELVDNTEIKELLWKLISALKDVELRIRILFSCLSLLTSQASLKFLSIALQWLPESHELKTTVRKKFKEMDVYQRIESCAQLELQRLPSKATFGKSFSSNVQYTQDPGLDIDDMPDPIHSRDFLEHVTTWPQIKVTSLKSSDLVLEFLLKCDQYSLARDWVEVFDFKDFSIIIDEASIVYHLEQKEPQLRLVIGILEQMKRQNPMECTKVCLNIMDRLTNKKYSAMLISFVRKNLCHTLSEDEIQRLCVCHLGCQALLCLPNHMQPEYDHLITSPLVLLEQLLMNMKVDLSSKVLACLKSELKLLQEGGVDVNSLEFDIKDADAILVEYAKKAVEFSVIQADSSSSGRASVLSHMSSGGGGGSLTMSGPGSASGFIGNTPTFSQQPRKLSMVLESGSVSPASRRLSMGANLGSTAPSARKMSRVDSGSQLSRLRYTGSSVPSNLDKKAIRSPSFGSSLNVRDTNKVFVMPAEPPSKDQWVPDSETIVCMLCRVERFSMFNRRHHCRRCGRVVCSTCSSKTLTIRGASARACDDCYKQSHQPKEVLSNKEKADRLRQRLTTGPGSAENSSPGIHITVGSPCPDEEMMSPPLYGENKYFLSMDQDMNEITREEFYYDHAPSSSLCLSILDLHSDSTQCSRVILELCDQVSTYLHTSETGLKNPEVDYGLVVSMLKHLLFHAKMKCMRAGDATTVNKCDLYLDRVNLLDLMVARNINYIPSIERLTRMDVLRQLRDKFLSEERWQLAMEVSTKCGIDPSGVWLAWGKSCLRMGDYISAREKLAKCLKVPSDKQSSQSFKMLTDVIECIENSAASLAGSDLITQLKSIKELLGDPQRKPENILEEGYVQECIYYLKMYGTYGSLVSYFQKHGLLIKALQLIMAESCSTEILIECLVMPCLHSGQLSNLFDALRTLDPSLTRWDTHLTSLCRYLNKNGLMNSLYHVQLFMKDYIRAAMTCVSHFYQKDATNYFDLHRRMHYLSDAKGHMESYLEKKMWTSVTEGSGKKGTEGSSRHIMTPREVSKNIHTIDLQLEVTKYLTHYQENLGVVLLFTSEKPPPSSPTRPHASHMTYSPDLFIRPGELTTLFGSTKMKSELVALVLLSGNNIHDGFGLGFRIIQDLKLDSTSIYSLVGTTLARQHKYSFIQQLLNCMKDSGLCTDNSFDDVIISCVEVMTRDPDQLQETEAFIKQLKSDVNKINMYMKCGKLKSAYLLAVKTQRVEVIQRIEQDAVRLNQPAVRAICQKWLKQHKH